MRRRHTERSKSSERCAFRALFGVACVLVAATVHGRVVINEFMASNSKTITDEDGDAEDWVELYNDSDADVDLEGWSLSDDAGEPRKWIFPSVTIPARRYLVIWLSGKDRVAIAPEKLDPRAVSGLPFEPTMIERGELWRYRAFDAEASGTLWSPSRTDYDDSDWSVGRSGFGFGDEDDATELPQDVELVYTRKSFELSDPSTVGNLVLSVDYDDGFIAFLNGVRVASSNAPFGFGSFSWRATAEHEAGRAERFDVSRFRERLVAGRNLLSVIGLEFPGSESADMSLEVELGGVPSVIHTNFQLERDGEEILLVSPDREIADGVRFPRQTRDRSYGRFPDVSGSWKYLLTSTPAFPNETAAFDEPISTTIDLSLPPGRYPRGTHELQLSAEPIGRMEIRYTLDGTEPDSGSSLYSQPFRLSRNTVIRMVGVIDGEIATETRSASYFIGGSYSGGTIDLPILSISMEPADYRWIQENTGARGRSAERPGFFEYFDASGRLQASTGFGMRLHGGAGRGGDYQTKKAYKAYFRGEYGDTKLRAPIIPETEVEVFDKLVLRANFNDSFRTNSRASLIRDELIRDVHENTGALASHGTWCVLYVNMEFRGLYNVVERMDEEFCESYLGGDDWDVIKTGNDVLVGDRNEWDRLRNFVVENDLSNLDRYREALRMIDVENFTSYMLVNMWAQNHDWPHNNWYAARPRTPDGKWIFLCWDAEFGIGLHPGGWSENTFEFVFSRGGNLREIFQGLLGSPVYRRYVVSQAERLAASALVPDLVESRIRALEKAIEADMPDELQLMGRTSAQWRANVDAMVDFARNRRDVFLGHVRSSGRVQGADSGTPVLLRVEPAEIVHTGSAAVTVVGQNINASTRVYLGSRRVNATVAGVDRVSVEIPFEDEYFGALTVRARHVFSGAEDRLDGALVVKPPVPVLTSIAPSRGDSAGGETVEIVGENFLEGVRVFFGNAETPAVVRPEGSRERLRVVTPPGRGQVEVRVVNTTPAEFASETRLDFTYEGVSFLRGDANESGAVDVSDAVAILGFLFAGGEAASCRAALDADRSGVLDLSDALTVLGYLFLNGPPLSEPFPDCGVSEHEDELLCETSLEGCAATGN